MLELRSKRALKSEKNDLRERERERARTLGVGSSKELGIRGEINRKGFDFDYGEFELMGMEEGEEEWEGEGRKRRDLCDEMVELLIRRLRPLQPQSTLAPFHTTTTFSFLFFFLL